MLAFKLRTVRQAPSSQGCYVLASAFHDVLYIGRAVNIQRRVIQHLGDKSKTNPENCPPPRILFYLEAYEHEKLEDEWLRIYEGKTGHLPPLNKNQASMPSL